MGISIPPPQTPAPPRAATAPGFDEWLVSHRMCRVLATHRRGASGYGRPMGAREDLLVLLEREAVGPRVLRAMEEVPRDRFVPEDVRGRAWENVPLPIGREQTISQPLVVAHMLEALDVRPGHRVLDVGTGSGWHAALLAALGGRVWSIERHPELAELARAALVGTGVEVIVGDGTEGWPEAAPYDRINVAAAATRLPAALPEQLAPGGRLVAPVGRRRQELVLVERDARGGLSSTGLGRVAFVPLVRGG